ncbi:MAG: helix-turn-helix transcriptional regulator [Desulforhopalus sp.]
MTIPSLPNLLTPPEAAQLLAVRFKALRLQAGYKRTTLAQYAGVTLASLKRFESTGQVSLINLLRLAHALDRLPEFADLFVASRATSLAELRDQIQKKTPKRGRI